MAGVAACLGWLVSASADEPAIRFETDVRPILKAHCFHCHGEEEKIEANLDLRLVRTLTRGGDSGAGLVAGNPGESLLLKRVISGEMPPKGKRLTDKEIATLSKWVEQGALTARPEPEAPPQG
ncbi:MAG: c-type cytochrome domain-containing protein, partial [Planctomyces sp.]